jgi:hypothetical protein
MTNLRTFATRRLAAGCSVSKTSADVTLARSGAPVQCWGGGAVPATRDWEASTAVMRYHPAFFGGKMSVDPSGVLPPLPSPREWEHQIREALRAQEFQRPRLRWTRRPGGRWDLHGDCPRCLDQISKVVSDVVASDQALEAATLVRLVLECGCTKEHTKGEKGCGAGRAQYVDVPGPQEPE